MHFILLTILFSTAISFLSATTLFFQEEPNGEMTLIENSPTEQTINIPSIEFENGDVTPTRIIPLSFLENIVDELKSKILDHANIDDKAHSHVQNTMILIMPKNHESICSGVSEDQGFIRIGSWFLSVLDFSNQENLNYLKTY